MQAATFSTQPNRTAYQHARRNLRVESLTPREREVLQLVAAGLSTREIAAELIIAGSTVKRHVATIFGKLGANRRTQAVAVARELALL
jgi:DNA-binding CsgD family transcriptional regulator